VNEGGSLSIGGGGECGMCINVPCCSIGACEPIYENGGTVNPVLNKYLVVPSVQWRQ
jgi:hypothetical protein